MTWTSSTPGWTDFPLSDEDAHVQRQAALRTLENAWPLPGGYGHLRELHQFALDRPGGQESARGMSNGTRASDQTAGRRSMSVDFQQLLQKASSPCSLMNFRSTSWMGYIPWTLITSSPGR